MPNKSGDEQERRARRIQELHERLLKDAGVMTKVLDVEAIAGVFLATAWAVIRDTTDRERAYTTLAQVLEGLRQHDGPAPGAERRPVWVG